MRKKLILFLMLALFGSTSFLRAEEVTIGSLEGAVNNSYLPMNSLYNYSYSQQIYTAEEVGMAGTINSITMWMLGPADLPARTFDIYIKEVDKEAFAGSTDWVTVAASDMVYSGTVAFNNTEAEPYTFTLTTPFVYSGEGNLLIAFNNLTGTWKSGLNGKVFGASGDPIRSIYVRQDSGAYDPYNPTFTATSTTYQRDVVMLDIAGGTPPTPPTPPVPTGDLTITPNPFDMGERPINAWMEPYSFRILNGGPATHIEAVISDVSGLTPFTMTPEINMDIAYEEVVEGVIRINDTIADGEYAEEFTLYYGEGKSMLQIPLTATVYTAVKPDVVEKKQTISATALAGFTYHPTGMHANYLLQGMNQMLPDAVYYFNLTKDSHFTASIDNGGIIAIYKYRSNFHPTTAIAPVLMELDEVETDLLAGKYYMIVASEELNGSTITGSAVELPAPEELTYIAPENMAHEISAPIELEWEGGANATQYQVIFGTDYPPTQVIQDWTPIDEYYGAFPIAELNNSTQYFWQIGVKNTNGELYGPVWGFTTTLVPPTNVTLSENQIFTDGSTLIKWSNMGGGGGFAGELTVADGTATSSYIPVYGLWMDDYTRAEMIYPADMLEEMNGGDITSLKYYISSAASGPWTGDVFNVYMMEVDATTLSTFYGSGSATIVYTGGLDGQGTEMVIDLDNSYTYGGGNLLIGIEETTCSTWKSCSFYGISATGASGSGYNASSVTAVPFTQRDFLPKTTFTCGARGYRDVTATRSLRGYNVYLTLGGVTPPTPPTPGGNSFTEGFEGGLNGWNVLTVNSAGGQWLHSDDNPSGYTYSTHAHTGTGFAMCYSYIDYVGAYYTDSYLYTPQKYDIVSGSTLTFWADNANDSYPENFSVCVATAETPSASDFTQVWSGGAKAGETAKAQVRHQNDRYDNWRSHSIDLSAYAGQSVWIAFHDVNYDAYEIWIDDVALTPGSKNRDDVPEAIKLNEEMLTENQFLFEPDETFYNMPNGAMVHVTAVYDEGESIYDSGNNPLYISGYTSFTGTVTELLSGAPIANAEVGFVGTDEFGNAATYNATTDENGEYEIEGVKVGNYTGTAVADGYELATVTDITNTHLTPEVVDFQLHEIYYPVYKVYAEDISGQFAKVQWSFFDFTPTPVNPGGGGGGGGGGGTGTGSTFTEDFENGALPAGWATIDADGDGSNWTMGSAAMGSGYGHNGSTDLVLSKSYDNTLGALNPNNYLVTSQVDLAVGSTFSFWACAQDNAWAAEHFGVAISTGSQTNASDFTMLQEWTMTAKGAGVPAPGRDGEIRTQGTWYQYNVDLSDYAGQQAYIAIRHFNCTDWFYLDVDDVALTNGTKADRSRDHFTLYRKAILLEEPIAAEDSINLIVDNLIDTLYADFDWFNVEPGLYQYGVSAVYPGAESGTTTDRGGYIIDFSTGDFSQFPAYTNSTTYPWVVVDGSHDGKAMKSSNGGVASSNSEITATVTYPTDGTVSFWALCMGEGTSTIWDKCIFQIDGAEQFCYGANQSGWNEYSYDITSGEHTFTWKYNKDSSVNPTGDYMMVDDINFFYAGGGGGDNPITDITWSNILPKDMGNVVVVNATSTTGSVEGATVNFVNQNPHETSFNFQGTFDETGELVFEDFRKGEYTLVADLEGCTSNYADPTAISIWNDTVYVTIEFTEKLIGITDLWISNTGYARWNDILPANGEVAERYIVTMNNVYQGETTNPYMQLDVNGLENGHNYTAKVAVIYSTGMSPWKQGTFTYQECDNTNPVLDTIFNNNMDIVLAWNGGTPTPPTPPTPPAGGWTESFESGMPAGWTVVDANNDGWTWCLTSAIPSTWTYYASLSLDWYRTGTNAICSGSYINGVGALTPNEYLITAPVAPTAGSTFSFWAAATDASYAADHFGVFVSTTGTNPSDFTMLNEWTLTAKSGGQNGGRASRDGKGDKLGSWHNFSVDLSSYAGQNIYVAIRHFNCTDMYIMCVDDVQFTADAKSLSLGHAGMGFGASNNSFTDDGNWYYYDNGTNDDAIGLTSGGSFYWGIMFPAGTYEGNRLTKVAYYDYTAHTGTINIYQGGSSAPQTLIYTQNYTATGSGAYIEFEMEENVELDDTQNVWVVMRNNNGQYVAAIDNSPGVNYGSCLSMDGSTWYTMVNQAASSLDGNWNLRAYIETGGGGGGGASAITPNKFNILVDGEVVGATSDNTFTWTCPDYDEHLYEVVWVDANYNISCPGGVFYQIPILNVNESSISSVVYPNPTNGDLHINAADMVRISIVNTLGQMVYDQAVKCDETVINMARFDAGVYMVNILTKNGSSVKRVVVTK
jgi:hypothetical protein